MSNNQSFQPYNCLGMGLDPIHVGTGGTRLGRVDNTIVRDPVTNIPKIPGSSLAGVCRAYAAMAKEDQESSNKRKIPYYPNCAGQGSGDDKQMHCKDPSCPVCTVFGFASGTGDAGGFAGLAGFSDMYVLLFPVATRKGPLWITSPETLRQLPDFDDLEELPDEETIYWKENNDNEPLNLGWLMLPVNSNQWSGLKKLKDNYSKIKSLPEHMQNRIAVVSDKLFSHIVNSNLEVRTSVAINPETGTAEEGALFTYEALPRATVLHWTVTCRNPKHFKINKNEIEAVKTKDSVFEIVKKAYPLLEHLGIGGMGTRGMGRLRVICRDVAKQNQDNHESGGE